MIDTSKKFLVAGAGKSGIGSVNLLLKTGADVSLYDGNEERNERLMENFEIIDALKISNNLANHLILENRRPLGTNNMNYLINI